MIQTEAEIIEWLRQSLRDICAVCENADGQPRPSTKRAWQIATGCLTTLAITQRAMHAAKERKN